MKPEDSNNWTVKFTNKASHQYQKLKTNGYKPSIIDIINLLVIEMKKDGPYRLTWPNYSPLDKDNFHCHLTPDYALLTGQIRSYFRSRNSHKQCLKTNVPY